MGVQGLWELLAPVGRRVSVETLAGKKLAVDASIWMVQFMKAMRDEKGEMVRNAHLLGFFRRICKLLFLRVRPVFVFDGATPALKRRTLAARRRHRDAARAKIRKTAEKLLINHLKARKLEEIAEEMRRIGEKGKEGSEGNDKGKIVAVDAPSEPSSTGDAAAAEAQERLDELLARSLAAEEEEVLAGAGESSGAGANEEEEDEGGDEELMLPELHGNIDPNILASLPPSIQLDLLVQMRERLMAENRQKYQKIKKAPAKFSQLQIQSYLKTVAFRREIDEVQKAAAGRGLGGVQTSRIASEANREFIFSTSFTGNKQMLSSLTMDKENNSMQSESTVKESTEVSNSSTSHKRILSQVSADVFTTNFGNDIETYRDERGRFRMSRIRALGIRMTRDIERNLDLMKEQEKEYYTRDTSVALEASIAGGDGVDFSSVDARVSQSTCFSGNDSVMEISFLDGDQVGQDDMGDHFFSHLVVGTSPTKSVADCKSVEKCSKDSSSDSDDLWEEGTNIVTKHLNTSSLNEKIQSCHVDEDVNWEENFAFPQVASNKHVECNVTLSKGLLEEEAEIKEAIRRSLEDVGQTFVKESLDHGLIVHVDGPIVPSSQNCSPEGLQLEQEIDDNVLHVHASAGENIEDQSSIKRCPVPNIKINRNCDSLENEGTSESTENTQHLILKSSSDISTDAGFSDKISAIVGQGQILRNCIVDSSEANLPSYPSSISAHNNITINKSFQQSEPFLPNRPVVDTDKQGEGLLLEDVTDAQSEKNYYGDKRELNQVKTAASADIMQSPITTPNLMEMTLDKKKLSNKEDNSLLTHMDKPRCDLEEATPLEYQKERQPQLSLDEEMSKLRQERENLGDEQRRHEINADSVSSEMFAECQELLQMFGLPYIIAPMEAEAQCAHMELVDLVDGVVTDDSDVFLFGGRSIYKNIFDDRKYVETYYMKDIESELGLTREKLIRMALLLGSDYTEGVSGIGIVNAIEVVHAFPDEDSLRKFREWLESPDPDILDKIDPRITGSSKKKLLKPANKVKDKSKKNSKSDESNLDESTEETSGILLDAQKIFMSKHRNVSKNWHMPSSFPSQTVISAYSSPQVDESTEPFSWGKPDLLLLRKLCWEKFGWSNLKADELLLPVLKEYSKHETQLRLEAFYSFNERFAKIRSQRIKKAVKGITGKLSAGLLGIPEQDESSPQEASRELDSSSVSQQTECDRADDIQPSNSRDGCIVQVNIEALDDIKHGQRKGRRGRGRGQESGKRKVTAYRNETGRGRARGRQRGKPGKDHLESGTSEDERNVSGSIDNAACTISEIRRSGWQHKMTKYTEESSEDDGSCLPGTSNPIYANQATAGVDPVTSMLGGHGEPCVEKLDYLEDNIRNDYLFSGGGFCADEDGTSTAGNPSEGVSSYMGEAAGSDRENIPGSECLTIQFKSKPESAQSGAEAPASTVNTSGLRSMPMLRRKRKKLQ